MQAAQLRVLAASGRVVSTEEEVGPHISTHGVRRSPQDTRRRRRRDEGSEVIC